MRFNRRQLLTATVQGLACAGLATLLTALVSWSFVAAAQPIPG